MIICEGWPSMGSDFGGVIALTPPLLGLLLVMSGLKITPFRLFALGAAAVIAIGLISGLDWLRGPDRRSHLGNFVQRILDGDALDVVARKAVASWQTIADPLGVFTIVLGIAVWVVAIRRVVPAARDELQHAGTDHPYGDGRRRAGHPAQRRRHQRLARRAPSCSAAPSPSSRHTP